MKEKQRSSRNWIIIAGVVFAVLMLAAVTAAGAFALRFANRGVDGILGQLGRAAVVVERRQESQDQPGSLYEEGVLVGSVEPGSPAAAAGIRRGSIILRVNGQAVNSAEQLLARLEEAGASTQVTLSVLNGAAAEEVAVTLADQPPLLGVRLVDDNASARFGRSSGEPFALPEGMPEFFRSPDGFEFNFGEFPAGVPVVDIVAGSAAEQAGVQPGDIITDIDGAPVESADALLEIIGSQSPGDSVTLSLQRAGETSEVTATLGSHPDEAGRAFLGVQPGAPAVGRGRFGPGRFGLEEGAFPSGSVIVEVVEDSPAAAAGLQPGDVVQAVDGEPVDTVDALVEVIGGQSPGNRVSLTIWREGEVMEIEATLATNPDDESRAYLGVKFGAFFDYRVQPFAGEEGRQFQFDLQPRAGFGDFLNSLPELEKLLPDLRPQIQPEEGGFDF